ncbi:MAG: flagellar basal body-associated FliL family protein [Deltaproteobacteria bacterium]|nr:flagellar basal body-associated FliL family protein [Deltaproteobacteria bacterium]
MAEKEMNPEQGSGGKSNLIKYLIIGVSALLLLGGGGAAGYFFFVKKTPPPATAEGQVAAGQPAQPKPVIGPMVSLESFIVNILDEQGTHYLKAAITLEMDKPATIDEVNQRMPQLRDTILLLVGNKTFKELADLQGKLQLRAELMASINKILKTGEVKKIYFTDFVVQ